MCRSSSQTYELYLLDCVGRGLQVGFSAASVYWAPWVAGLWTSSGLWVTRCRWVSLNPNLNPWVVSSSLDCPTVVFVRFSLVWKLCSSAPPFEIRQPWLHVDLSSKYLSTWLRNSFLIVENAYLILIAKNKPYTNYVVLTKTPKVWGLQNL